MALGFEQQSYFNRTGFGRMAFGALATEKKVYISGTAAGAGSGSMETLSGHEVDFDITLQPGDVLVLDSESYTVRLNGQELTADYTGRLPKLGPGETWMIYKDENTSRKVQLSATYTERYV